MSAARPAPEPDFVTARRLGKSNRADSLDWSSKQKTPAFCSRRFGIVLRLPGIGTRQ
jgi:hypothetical protein